MGCIGGFCGKILEVFSKILNDFGRIRGFLTFSRRVLDAFEGFHAFS